MNDEKTSLLGLLGRTQSVTDVEKAYRALFNAKRQSGVKRFRAKQDAEYAQREIELFLDDVKDITGLDPATSRLFWEIAAVLMSKKHREIERQRESRFMRGDIGSFPDDEEQMGDW